MAARPLVTVQPLESDISTTTIPLPHVMKAPIRADIVNFVHSNISKNSRQSFAVSRKAGHQTSAGSWGTGRAVSRIPRVRGGGTHRAGQAAFGNMCRGGRMFAPTRIWRKWHRKINVNQKRYAVVSAIAASAVPSLVAARGHVVDSVPEIPLVVSDSVGSVVEKTRHAISFLKQIGAFPDVEKALNSVGIRPGVGKFRNRRYLSRKGPLIVYGGLEGTKFVKAFRNIPGVEVANVDRLNLLKLAPGGHLGRFIIWTKSAFQKLNSIYGSLDQICETNNGYLLPRPKMVNADLASIINSEEVQSVVKPINKEVKRAAPKMNPLKRYRYRYPTYVPKPKAAKKRRPNNPLVSYHPTTHKIADPLLTAAILKLVKQTAEDKNLQTGRNRVKSSLNRGLSQLVVMAADVDDPVECIPPLPSLAEEKDVPYVFVPSKDALGQACGLNVPVFACSVDQEGRKDSLRLMVRIRDKFNRGADQGTVTLPTLTGGRKVLKLVYGANTHA